MNVDYVCYSNRFNDDIEFMIGHKPNLFWQITWRFVSPAIMFVIFVFYFITKVTETLLYKTWNPESVRFLLCQVYKSVEIKTFKLQHINVAVICFQAS